MTKDSNVNNLSIETNGTTIEKIVVAILLLVPIAVFSLTPLYNTKRPELFGLTFFYWFQAAWLVVTSIFYILAAMLLNRMEGGN